jgi:hypothetical protein
VTVARAKHTDRADARRRWRQTQSGDPDSSAVLEPAGAPAPRSAASPAQRSASVPAQRPSIMAAFRNAYRPAQIREDIAALPWLIRSRAFLISLALVVGGVAAVAVAPSNAITNLFFQAMVVPPAMAPIFIVGFFATRASYLLGFIVAIVDVIAYSVFIYTVAPGLTTEPIDPAQQQQLVLSALSVGPLSGIFFAAAAAWYRRFLTLSNASAAQRARARQQQKPRPTRPSR